MTHDKAVELAHHAMINSKSRAHGLVDALVAIGVADFNASPAPPQVATLAYLREMLVACYGNGPYYIDQIQTALAKANLELVERK